MFDFSIPYPFIFILKARWAPTFSPDGRTDPGQKDSRADGHSDGPPDGPPDGPTHYPQANALSKC